ncbi:glycosyltransferase family 69 protein [Hypholoma sublateritium FD-334 SS-4]|uniref:Glycosyltransferase family 69 protein n=1 Tax=Hypholoma sublateritium (strain FD-334 SS-4) TaxID=945553 RepID=A0A0D2MCT3_HYPSF|nr:glycosyltransferase family 69 protein [Hypholoma sublateritium FD-334 SS-4]
MAELCNSLRNRGFSGSRRSMEPHDEIAGALLSEDPVHYPLGDGKPRPRMAFWRIEAIVGVVKGSRRYDFQYLNYTPVCDSDEVNLLALTLTILDELLDPVALADLHNLVSLILTKLESCDSDLRTALSPSARQQTTPRAHVIDFLTTVSPHYTTHNTRPLYAQPARALRPLVGHNAPEDRSPWLTGLLGCFPAEDHGATPVRALFLFTSSLGYHIVLVVIYDNSSSGQAKALLGVFDALTRSVQSCWNDIAVFDPAPFYLIQPVRLHMAKISQGECSVSECSLICNNHWNVGSGGIMMMILRVKLAHDNCSTYIVYPNRWNPTAICGYTLFGDLPHTPLTDPQDLWCWDWDSADNSDGLDVDRVWERILNKSIRTDAVACSLVLRRAVPLWAGGEDAGGLECPDIDPAW